MTSTFLKLLFGRDKEELIPIDYFPQAVPDSNGGWLGLYFCFDLVFCQLMPFLLLSSDYIYLVTLVIQLEGFQPACVTFSSPEL